MHYCYLLRSARDPRRAYVGYAPNVQARLDAHNGKRPGGARATRNYRPWKVVAIVSGFASERAALCFEYAWHFPQKPGLVHGRQQFPAHVLYIKSMKGGYKALRDATKGLIRGGDAFSWNSRVLNIILGIEFWKGMNLRVRYSNLRAVDEAAYDADSVVVVEENAAEVESDIEVM